MSDTKKSNVLSIVFNHLFEKENPPQLPAETQEVLLKISKNNDIARTIYQLYLTLPLLVRYAYEGRSEWFDAVAELSQGDDNSTLTLKFQMIKVSFIYSTPYPISVVINRKFHQPGHTLLFHGAKHTSSVDDILHNGINLKCGRNNLDFSSGSGFYLSDDFQAAKEWVMKYKNGPCAVIIYRVPNNLLEYGEKEGADLKNHKDAWSIIVKYYRKYKNNELDKVDLFLNFSFYKGPICRNGAMIQKGIHAHPTPLVINGREVQQYCIRREHLAQKFNSLVVGVVIYD